MAPMDKTQDLFRLRQQITRDVATKSLPFSDRPIISLILVVTSKIRSVDMGPAPVVIVIVRRVYILP